MHLSFVPYPICKHPDNTFECGISILVNLKIIKTIAFVGREAGLNEEVAKTIALQLCHAYEAWLDHGQNKRLDELLAAMGDHCRKEMFAAARPNEIPWAD